MSRGRYVIHLRSHLQNTIYFPLIQLVVANLSDFQGRDCDFLGLLVRFCWLRAKFSQCCLSHLVFKGYTNPYSHVFAGIYNLRLFHLI